MIKNFVKMKFLIIIVIICLASTATSHQVEVVENEEGELFELIPLNRVRRSYGGSAGYGRNNRGNRGGIYGRLDVTDPGRVVVGAKHTPINDNTHLLRTHIYGTDNIRHSSPLTVGGEASYLHKPSLSTFEAKAAHTEKFGTDLGASAKFNFYEDKTAKANVEGYVAKHLGGLPGNQPTDYGVMLSYLHKPSLSTFEAKAAHTERLGTDLGASGTFNFYQDKTTNANVEGYVAKHLGGLPGNQPTDYGVMLNVEKKF